MSLRSRFLAMFLGLALLVIAAAVVLTALGDSVDDRASVQAQRWQPASLAARALLSGAVDQETGERGYLITGDTRYLVPYAHGKREVTEAVSDLRRVVGSDRLLATRIDTVAADIATWRRTGPRPEIAAAGSVGLPGARALVATGRGKAAFDALRDQVEALQDELDARLTASDEAVRDASHTLATVRLALLVLLLALVAAAGYAVRSWVVRPVAAMQRAMTRVSAGDLDTPIPVTGPREVADLSRGAEAMRVRLVTELERATGAREALEDEAPVIAALRRELAATPGLTPGVRVAGVLRPAEGVLAGDWFDAVVAPGGRTALVLTDVSGHGAEAGVVATWMRRTLSTSLRRGRDAAETLEQVAESFLDDHAETERFATVFIAVIDPAARTLAWANAGHPAALVMAASPLSPAATLRHLEPTGPIVSSLGGAWHTSTTTFGLHDLVVIYSDGLSEARDAGSAELGEAGILRALTGLADADPETAVSRCLRAFDVHAQDRRRDDVTVLAASLEVSAPRPRDEPLTVGR